MGKRSSVNILIWFEPLLSFVFPSDGSLFYFNLVPLSKNIAEISSDHKKGLLSIYWELTIELNCREKPCTSYFTCKRRKQWELFLHLQHGWILLIRWRFQKRTGVAADLPVQHQVSSYARLQKGLVFGTWKWSWKWKSVYGWKHLYDRRTTGSRDNREIPGNWMPNDYICELLAIKAQAQDCSAIEKTEADEITTRE